MKEHKLSIILWNDAEDFQETWASEEEAEKFSKEECLVQTAGYILKKTKTHLTIAGDIIKDGEDCTYGRVFKIPIKMIRSINNIK